MDLELNDEQRAVVDSLRRQFAAAVDSRPLREVEASDPGWMPEVWFALGQGGFLGLGVLGADERDLMSLALLGMECGRAMLPVPLVEAGIAGLALLEGFPDGPDLGDYVEGRSIALPVAAVSLQDGAPVTAPAVPYATAADVFVLVDSEAGRYALIDAADAEVRRVPAMGPAPYGSVIVREPVGVRRGAGSIARATTLAGLARASIAAGGMAAAVEYATSYVKTRRQFSRPVGSFQAVQHRLADAATTAEQARLLVMRAASARQGDALERATAAASLYCLPGYRDVAAAACQVLGGYGFTLEFDSQIHLRSATTLLVAGAKDQVIDPIIDEALAVIGVLTP